MTENKIAVDLGGTNLRVALVENNKIKTVIKQKTPKTKKALLKVMVDMINKLKNSKTKGVGVSSPGPLEHGVIKNTPNLPIKNFNLKGHLEKKLKIKVEVENDANCAALAEAKIGCKKQNFFVITIGTGIGGGIIINNELYTGMGFGGELGHIIIDDKKDLEDLTGGKHLKKVTKKYFKKSKMTLELIESDTKGAKEILEKEFDYLGQGLASLISVFDPEVIVLAGGVKEAGDRYLKRIKKATHKYTFIPRKTKIIWSRIKEPGILGASFLV